MNLIGTLLSLHNNLLVGQNLITALFRVADNAFSFLFSGIDNLGAVIHNRTSLTDLGRQVSADRIQQLTHLITVYDHFTTGQRHRPSGVQHIIQLLQDIINILTHSSLSFLNFSFISGRIHAGTKSDTSPSKRATCLTKLEDK